MHKKMAYLMSSLLIASLTTPAFSNVVQAAEITTIHSGQISVQNQYGSADKVIVTGLNQGEGIAVYENGARLGGIAADENGSAVLQTTLDIRGGSIRVARTYDHAESMAVSFAYPEEVASFSPTANIALTNAYSGASTVTIPNLPVGSIITVSSGTTTLAIGVALSSTLTLPLDLDPKGGNLSIHASFGNLHAAPIILNYPPITVPAVSKSQADIRNNSGNADSITVNGQISNDKITVFDHTGILGVGTVNTQGAVTIPVTLDSEGGILKISVQHEGAYGPTTTLAYGAEIVPALSYDRISLSSIVNGSLNVRVHGLLSGDIVRIYGNHTLLGSASSTATGLVTIPVAANASGGSLHLSVSRGNRESSFSSISYGAITVPPLNMNDVTLSNINGANGVVTVKEQTQGHTITVYGNGRVLGSANVTPTGEVSIPVQLNAKSGFLAVSLTSDLDRVESLAGTLPYIVEPFELTPPKNENIAIANNSGNVDYVRIKTPEPDEQIRIYDGAGLLQTQTTGLSGADMDIPVTLSPFGGRIEVASSRNGIESLPSSVAYSAETADPIVESQVEIYHALNSSYVEINSLEQGDRVRLYEKGNLLEEKTADAQGSIQFENTLFPKGGALFFTRLRNGIESSSTQINYRQMLVPAISEEKVSVNNREGNNDTVIVNGMSEGGKVILYNVTNEILGTQQVPASGEVSFDLSLLPQGGAIYAVLSHSEIESDPTRISYDSESSVSSPQATIISIVENVGVVSVSNLPIDSIARVYEGEENLLGQAPADSNGSSNIEFRFLTSNGKLFVRFFHNNLETGIASFDYQDILIPQPTAALTNISGAQGAVTVTKAIPGQTVRLYSDANVQLAEETADGNGQAILEFTFPTRDGNLSVRTVANGTETEIASIPYSGVDIPVMPQPTAIISDIDGDQGTVTVTNVVAGQTVRVYSDANSQLAEQTANASGTAMLGFTFPNATGELSVRTVANGTETEIAALPYSGVVIPVTPDPQAILSSVNGSRGTVTVTNALEGQLVRVYGGAGLRLAEITANAEGKAELAFTFPNVQGSLSVRVVSNDIEMEIAQLAYRDIVFPTPVPVDPEPNPSVPVPVTESPVTPAPTTPVIDPPTTAPPVDPQPIDPQPTFGPVRVSLTAQNLPVFTDTNGHWAQTEILRLQSLGILTGVGNGQFAPQAVLTRAQFVQMISNLLKLDPSAAPYRYADVPGDAWYLDAVRAASVAGIVSGYTDDSFKPNRLVTREEMVHMIGNAIRYLDSNAPLLSNANGTQALSSFRDASSVGGWARENLNLAVNAGLVQGKSNGSLSPKSNTTRAEAAVILSRVIDRMNDYFEID